jgi:Flp pilus assembly protein TadD
VNIPPDGLLKIDAPVTEYYRLIDEASDDMNKGRHEAAIPLLREALATNPGDAIVHNSYGSALAETGHLDEALEQYRKATQLSPDYPDAHNNLGSALLQVGRAREAIPEFRKALALKPSFSEAHSGLGGALAQLGRTDEAIQHLQKAVEYSPQNPRARANLSLALAMAGRVQEAIPHAEQAVALTNRRDPMMLDMLGSLYARGGRMTEAVETARLALEVAARGNDPRLTRDLREHLSSEPTSGSPPAGRFD